MPGYPVAGTHTRYYGGEVYKLPLLPENDFYPDLDSIPAEIRRRAKLLVINYPNSPTGQVATRDFYRRVIDFAPAEPGGGDPRRGACHVQLRRPGIELPTGAGCPGGGSGDPLDVERLEHDRLAAGVGMRSRADRRAPSPTSRTIATRASSSPSRRLRQQPWTIRRFPARPVQKYHRRLSKLVQTLTRCGFQCRVPGGTYFLYTPSPKGIDSKRMLRNGRRSQPISDRAALDLHRSMGRCRLRSSGSP